MRRVLPCLLLAFAGPAPAQELRDVTPAHYFTLSTVTELAVSPAGGQVAYCVATWNEKADNRRTDLWVVSTDGDGIPRRLTSDRANDRHPRWDAAGKAVYVLGNRRKDGEKEPPFDGSTQVWRVPADRGEVTAVTAVSGGVTGFDLAPAAAALFYSVDTNTTDEDPFTKLRMQFPDLEYGHGRRKVSELYRLGLDGGKKAERVVAEKRYIHEISVTPDGRRVAMITTPDDTVVTFEGRSRVDVWDAGTGKVTTTDESWRETAASPWPWLESVAISPDGDRVACCAIFDAYPAEVIVADRKGGAWAANRLPRRANPERGNPGTPFQVRGYGTPLKWVDNNRLSLLTEHHALAGWMAIDVERLDTIATFTTQDVINAFDFAPGSRRPVWVSGSNRSFPVLRTGWGADQILHDPNRHARDWKLPSVRHITWKAPDGTRVGGVLELPHGYQWPVRVLGVRVGERLPLVVAMHGGPTTASHADLEFDPLNGRLYFAAAGYAVLCPNYRGSTGYGDKFVTDLIGNENDIEVKDILAGIKHLIDEGIADPDRIAVTGWSNGGYLTNCLITLKDPPVKFRAASSGAGILDTVAEWGFNDEPAYPTVFKKGFPWETPEVYRKTSPTYGLGNVKTPTLIHVGGADERCPPGHSRMLYRALKEYLKVPTELVVYPGEPHGLTKYTNRKAKMEWDLAWFEKYVKKSN